MSAREVTLVGGSPWGFRMHGGYDLHQPLRISRVNPGSKAAQQGVREGDLISSINGRSTRDLTNSEAHALLRNAGEHLKLGLNQENIGSPKRRIYKSSLQENTTTEILNKTTTKTTSTSNTRVITTESKKNEINDTKPDQSYASQNGGPKSSLINKRDEIKTRSRESSDYATDTEELTMPHGTRNRRNRRGRNRKRFQRHPSPEGTSKDDDSTVENPEGAEAPEDPAGTDTNDSCTENIVRCNELQQKDIRNESIEAATQHAESSLRKDVPKTSRYTREDRYKIEKGTVEPGIKVVEITTISSLPLEAKIEHIPGVGILETGYRDRISEDQGIVTISEPIESFPCSSTKISHRTFEESTENSERLQIHDVSDCDVETDYAKPVIVEMESDSEKETAEGKHVWDTVMPRDVERKLRNFIEGLKLPTYPDDLEDTRKSLDKVGNCSSKKFRKRNATMEFHHAHSQAASRFLDIIQEEGEKLSEDEEQHIRDFINEEIGKYRRDERNSDRRKWSSENEEMEKRESSVKINVINVDSDEEEMSLKDDVFESVKVNKSTSLNELERKNGVSTKNDELNQENLEKEIEEIKTIEKDFGNEIPEDKLEDESSKLHGNDANRLDAEKKTNGETLSSYSTKEFSVSDKELDANAETSKEELEDADSVKRSEEQSQFSGDSLDDTPNDPKSEQIERSEITASNEQSNNNDGTLIKDVESSNKESEDVSSQQSENNLDDATNITKSEILKCSELTSSKEQLDNSNEPLIKGEENSNAETKDVDSIKQTESQISENDISNVTKSASVECSGLTASDEQLENRNVDSKDKNNLDDTSEIVQSEEVECSQSEKEESKLDKSREIVASNSKDETMAEKSIKEESNKPSQGVNVNEDCTKSKNPKDQDLCTISESVINEHSSLTIKSLIDSKHSTSETVTVIKEQRRPPTPPKRSSSLPDVDFQEKTNSQPHRKETSDSPPTRPPLPKENLHPLEPDSSGTSSNKATGILDPSLKIISRDDTIMQNSSGNLSNTDSPEKIHEIIDDLRADDTKLQNDVENGAKLGSATSTEITRDCEKSSVPENEPLVSGKSKVSRSKLERSRQKVVQNETTIQSKKSSKNTTELRSCEEEFEEIYNYSMEHTETKLIDHQHENEKVDSEILESILNDKRASIEQTNDFQGQDSSSSATTLSTVKYNPMEAWQADICSIIAEEARKSRLRREAEVESCSLKSKLPLLKGEEVYEATNGHEGPVTPEPIPYSPVENLPYKPVDNSDISSKSRSLNTTIEPEPLKDLCVKKILSMPYGPQIINEIMLPKFNIFKSLRPISRFANDDARGPLSMHGVSEQQLETAKLTASPGPVPPDHCKTTVSDQNKSLQLEQKEQTMAADKPETWVGLSTSKDPRLLLCLSPSQQKTAIKTSADNLLDLHKKFLNRHSYYEEEPPPCIPVPRYKIDVRKPNSHSSKTEDTQSKSTNRLLEIIKENSDSWKSQTNSKRSKLFSERSSPEKGNERFKVTRLCDWLNLARQEPVDIRALSLSDDLHAEPSGEGKRTDKRRIHIAKELVVDSTGEHGHRVNAAPMVNPVERPDPPVRSSTPFNRSPITLNTALIDKSDAPDTAGKRTPPKRTIDPRYNVNPALIDDRVEVPPRIKRVVNVDRSCIDTRSIFDQSPARCSLEPRKYGNAEGLKHTAATEIVQNLKKFQTERDRQPEGRSKYSIPEEYLAQQLKYIELLENQLKNVILAEEEEKEAFEKFQTQVKQKLQGKDECFNKTSDSENLTKNSNDDSRVESESWREKSEQVEKNHSEKIDKQGHRDFVKKVQIKNGVHEEETCEKIERTEHSVITNKEKKDDRKTRTKTEIPKASAVVVNGEAFRQRMYDEYVHKVLEREERKQHKVVKISSHQDIQKLNNKLGKSDMSVVEREFIEKARNRLNKFGIKLDDSEPESDGKRDQENIVKAKCLIDGKELEDARKLPKHLQEFLKMSGEDDCSCIKFVNDT